MITSLPSSPEPSSITLTAVGESGVPIRVMPPGLRPQLGLREVGDRFGRDVELAVEALVGRAGAEAVHADKAPAFAGEALPAEGDAGFDRDAHRRAADGLQPIAQVLRLEELPAGGGDHPR